MTPRGTHDDDDTPTGDFRDRLIRVEERQREVLRRLAETESGLSEAIRQIDALGTALKLQEFRLDAIDERSKDSERVIRRLAWIVITWAAGLVLGAAAYVLKITGGGGAIPHG